MPLLKQGSRGPDVTALQTKLKQLGFDPKEVDGIFGPGTKAALIAFQTTKDFPADGMAGPATMAALQEGESATTDGPQSSSVGNAGALNPDGPEGVGSLKAGGGSKVGEHQGTARFDRIVNKLVDGNEEQRSEVLRQIQTSKFIDKAALAARLRTEIAGDYSPNSERQFALAVRDPKRLSSVRSWMLSSLIWADAEDNDSRVLILRHVAESSEPDRNVRYWTLAGLYWRDASYLREAVKEGLMDTAHEVAALAEAIRWPDDPKRIEKFRSNLLSNDFETAWQVLRLLRIVPIPKLTNDVCDQLERTASGTPLAYDALYALSQPEMASHAVKRLTEHPGVEQTLAHVIAAARGSNQNASRSFAILLAAFEYPLMDRLLREREDDPETRDTAQLLRHYLNERRGSGDSDQVFVAGYASDTIDVRDDDLGIQEDVQTLTAVMLAREVEPPLAVGLFGDWGTGKSFFMKSMKAAVDDLAGRSVAPNSRFCSNIAQIEFNAWHYVDTNLWASLVSYILEQLAAYVTPQLTDEQQQAALLSELGSAKAIVAEAEAEKLGAEAIISERQEALQGYQIERQKKEVKLQDLRMADLATLLLDHQPLKNDLVESLNEIGVPAALKSVSDLSHVVSEAYTVRGRATALFMALLNAKNRRLMIGLLLVVLLAIPVIAYLAHRYLLSDSFTVSASAIIAQIAGIIVAATTVLRRAVTAAKSSLDKVEAAKQRVDRLVAEKRETPTPAETDLQNEIASLKAKEQEAAARVAAAAARVVELEERIRAIKEGRSLARFLAERTRSEDYRKHLGLISTIRKDFESLATRLASARLTPEPGFRAADRIILYIDDLDRCPADKVMDVLQAVHLLLAYPLFVVVVGVDPRWLLHSLGTTYTAFKSDQQTLTPARRSGGKPDVWRTTPQNYLEKIFQIPFNLRRMTGPGYTKLISKLLSTNSTPEPESLTAPPEHVKAAPESEIPPTPPPEDQPTEGQSPDPNANPDPLPEPDSKLEKDEKQKQDETRSPKFVIQEESLVIKDWEAKFAVRLFPLIPSPRAAKRFSNVYRILKARVRREDLAQFEGTEEVPGDFQIPMLLLAMLIGAPVESAMVFPQLYQQASRGKDVTDVFQNLKTEAIDPAAATVLSEKLVPLTSESTFPNAPEVFLEWIPRVSRFSFEVGRVVDPITATEPPWSKGVQPAIIGRISKAPTID
jgi:outer membrane biosynthesis protein TonB